VSFLGRDDWSADQLRSGTWQLASHADAPDHDAREVVFGMPGAIPIVGDFNGDGIDEVGVFYEGEWFLDVNGNGRWDDEDLWARLGDNYDLPVVGDWDGDGKDDIGIYGPKWPGDDRAIEREPGLPDSMNSPANRPKNMPPEPHEATSGWRLLKRTSRGEARADLIDHVFRYGVPTNAPVAGDFNGDGIDTIGTMRDGHWQLDVDGDGRISKADRTFDFGRAGDRAVVGDFNGDGVDEVGIYRDGTWIIDTNGNYILDEGDLTFQWGGPGDVPVVGDFNGDGVDDVGLYREGAAEPVWEARK
jgi:hypothetical protein